MSETNLANPQKAPYTQEQLQLIINTVAKGASKDELKLFMMVAHRTGLDPFSKQIHFVKRGEVGTIQTGIDGYRAIAERSGKLAGIDDPLFDQENAEHPEKATVTVHKMIDGQRVPFTASARWKEYAVSYNGKLSTMWQKMPYLMLGKCAEALALRKAFPNDLSGIYTNEEMQQADTHTVEGQVVDTPIKPSQQQMDLIDKLMDQKWVTKEQLHDHGFNYDKLTGGRGGTASELIDYLIKLKPEDMSNPNPTFDPTEKSLPEDQENPADAN